MNKDVKSYVRNHSFSKSPSLAQVASWFIFTAQALVFYIYVINQFQSNQTKISMTVLFTISFIGLIIFAIYTGQSDPSDELVISYKNKQLQKIIDYKSQGNRVYYCSYCQSAVKQKSRHCRTCSNCSQSFDHHCIWLNICIGGKNYRAFLITIILTFATFFFYLLSIGLLTSQFITYQKDYKTAGFIITWIMGVITAVFIFLITNLILLHIYLNYKGLSTYEFIMLKNEQKKKQQQEQRRKKQQKQRNQRIRLQAEQKTSANINKVQRKIRCIDQVVQPNIQQNQQKINDLDKQSMKNKQKKTKQTQVQVQKSIKLQQSKVQNKNGSDSDNTNIVQQSIAETVSVLKQLQSVKSQYNNDYYIYKKSQKKPKINKFFTVNASYDFLIGKNQSLEPHQNLLKNIQLDQQIEVYKKHASMFVDADFMNKKKTNNKNQNNSMHHQHRQSNSKLNKNKKTKKNKVYDFYHDNKIDIQTNAYNQLPIHNRSNNKSKQITPQKRISQGQINIVQVKSAQKQTPIKFNLNHH